MHHRTALLLELFGATVKRRQIGHGLLGEPAPCADEHRAALDMPAGTAARHGIELGHRGH